MYTSQRKRPGEKFVRFFKSAPDSINLPYITTNIGENVEDNDERLVIKTPASIHTFEWCDDMEYQNKVELTLNVLAMLKDGRLNHHEWTKWADKLLGELGKTSEDYVEW